ncbi:MAG: MMPL family transporter, partial [Gammaproteobacteria bacterium]|nr:MMPL family transporter [Gammaproteobacteria bacterium]
MPENKLLKDYTKWVLTHPVITIILCLAMAFLAASGGRFLSFTTNYRVFFSADNPELLAFEKLENTYTKNDNVMFVLTPNDGSVFTSKTLEAVKLLTERAWQIPYSSRVDSISNFQHTEAEGDDLLVRDLVEDPVSLDKEALDRIRKIALSEPLLVDRLISPAAQVTGVNATIQLPGKDPTSETPEVVNYARTIAQEIRDQYPHLDVRITGMVLMNNAFTEASQKDMQTLIPLSFGLMLLTLAFMIRGFSGTFATLMVIIASVITALGIGGYIGYPITPPSASTPTIVLTIAIASSVHILVTFVHSMSDGMSKHDAMVESLRINMQPVFLTTVTTAIGFLSMNFSDVPPFHHLGNMVAIGVVASFVFSVAMLPAMMMLLPVKAKKWKTGSDSTMYKIGDFVVRKRKLLLWLMLFIAATLISFIPRNELNDVFVHYFDKTIDFRVDSDYANDNLSGSYVIDYSLESQETGGINEVAFLQEVEDFANWYRQQPEVKHVNSITDIMKRLNKNMHGDDPDWYRLPDERELAAQYLLLYEMSLPYGLDLNNQINLDKSATRFVVTLGIISSNAIIAMEEKAAEWLKQNSRHIKSAEGSGPTVMFAHVGKRNIVSMLYGTTVALIFISLILIFALRSFKIGMVSLVPNLIPAGMGFGLWGMAVGEIGLALSIVAGMTLGIVVDDTVHFLSKYLRARREGKYDPQAAVRYAFSSVGWALFVTSVVLIAGFLVLAMSSFKLNSGMGMLTAIVIAFALVAD